LHLLPLPALEDNYIWLLHDGHDALVVDPGQADVVEQALERHQLTLRAILLTHHHADHTGGVAALQARHAVPVHAPEDARIAFATQHVGDGSSLALATPAVEFQVLAVPGHTLSHIAWHGPGLLFAGDTLFSLGCGRLFEGTPAQMLASLDRLAALPDATLVCAAHEYTAANGRFAAGIEPGNAALARRLAEVTALRQVGQPTLPVTLGTERTTNPFLRVDAAEIVAWGTRHGIAATDRVTRFAALRAAKDGFRG